MKCREISVLIVEDELIVAMHLEDEMRSFGFSDIDVCTNFDQARMELKDKVYDLALMDIYLGNRTSYDLANFAHECGSIVIIISGSVLNCSPHFSHASDFIRKPWLNSELRNAVKRATEALA
ncbi:response regulator [Litoreibacter roseus]|uniref:response regulator n=1 Tax=Litoreibacter roseus TaxID=2601869 RepID=UPI001359329D